MDVNIEHVIALVTIGAGALILLYTNHVEAGIALFGALAGYAFKNGLIPKKETPN